MPTPNFGLSDALRLPRRAVGKLLRLAPVGVWRRVLPQPDLSLCYHMVSNAEVPHLKHYQYLGIDEFERDLHDLEAHFGYVSYEQILNRRSGREPTGPDTSMCLTFDDGFAECVSVVRPILLRHGATCVFFVITDLIDNHAVFRETAVSLCVHALQRYSVDEVDALIREFDLEARIVAADASFANAVPAGMARQWMKFEPRLRPLFVWLLTLPPEEDPLLDRLCARLGVEPAAYVEEVKPYLSSEQILQLRSDGFTIGAHSCTHRRLQDMTLAEAEQEIVQSCRRVQELTGQASVPFAFPYSGWGLDRSWLATLRERNPFIGLFYDTQGLRRDSSFVVQRVFGERIEEEGPIERLLRRAWARRVA